jgi:hypothetical protein
MLILYSGTKLSKLNGTVYKYIEDVILSHTKSYS